MGQYFVGFCEDCEEWVDLNKLGPAIVPINDKDSDGSVMRQYISDRMDGKSAEFPTRIMLAFIQKHNCHKVGITGDETFLAPGGKDWNWLRKCYKEIWPNIWG
jgi:hypothetical protein